MQEGAEVLGLRSGDIEADEEVNGTELLRDAFPALPQGGLAGGGLGELEFGGGRLEILLEEGGLVSVAGGVDADAAASGRLRNGSVVW